jgi:hypothetical protein
MIPFLNFLYSGVLRSHIEISAWYCATGMQNMQWSVKPVRLTFAHCSFMLTSRCLPPVFSKHQTKQPVLRTPGPMALSVAVKRIVQRCFKNLFPTASPIRTFRSYKTSTIRSWICSCAKIPVDVGITIVFFCLFSKSGGGLLAFILV